MKAKDKIQVYNKAIVAVVGAAVAVLATQGIDVDPAISGAVITIITGAFVVRVPNKTKDSPAN